MSLYERSFKVRAALSEVAAFHDDPVSLAAITPPPVHVTILRFDKPVRAGSSVIFRLSVGPFGVTWDGTITEYVDQRYFRDVQNSARLARGATRIRSWQRPTGRTCSIGWSINRRLV